MDQSFTKNMLLLILALLSMHPSPFVTARTRTILSKTATTSSSLELEEYNFRLKIDKTLSNLNAILDTTRTTLKYASHATTPHSYSDKYSLSEYVTNMAIASTWNVLNRLNLDYENLEKLQKMSENWKKRVTFRLDRIEMCNFVKEEIVEIESRSPHSSYVETEEVTTRGETMTTKTTTTKSKVMNKVHEYHYTVTTNYTLFAFVGNDVDDGIVLQQRDNGSKDVIVRGGNISPFPKRYSPSSLDVDVTWLLTHLLPDENNNTNDSTERKESERVIVSNFEIDRISEKCHTPKNNEQVLEALDFFRDFGSWSEQVGHYFFHMNRFLKDRMSTPATNNKKNDDESCVELPYAGHENLFVPVIPLFEDKSIDSGESSSREEKEKTESILPSPKDNERLLAEQCRSINSELQNFHNTYSSPDTTNLITSKEASIYILSLHASSISKRYIHSIQHIEHMLTTQLIQAIGKELHPSDFEHFFKSHYKKLFKEDYRPLPFSYSIRRPDHYPDGTLSIESTIGDDIMEDKNTKEPIMTITKKISNTAPMSFPLNAATSVEFGGDRYLHAWVLHDFQDNTSSRANLVARARQFSSFLLLVGNISGPTTFQPQHALILQNKDEAILPLLLEQLPTPKEFRDAIESLSPEQQQFALAFRSMQLESSVFGCLVIQLKPQLELVLGLPYDSLTKEIRLTQDLLSLFIDYQIPSDLLTYDGNDEAPVEEKISRVKTHVNAVMEMISEAKEAELEKSKKETDMMHEKSKQERLQKIHGAAREQMRTLVYHSERDEGVIAEPSFSQASESAGHRVLRASSAQNMNLEKSALKGSVPRNEGASIQTTQRTDVNEGGENMKKVIKDGNTIDFTMIPKQLDAQFEALDEESALRPTKISTDDYWRKTSRGSLLSPPRTKTLGRDEQKAEKNNAFDLLDALSKSGALPIEYAELHVLVAATHRFDKSLMATLIQDNINPIEKMEKSLLIVSSTINDVSPANLLEDSRASELAKIMPSIVNFEDNMADLKGNLTADIADK